jgi:tetratricopeptide (TPR) repeat protein
VLDEIGRVADRGDAARVATRLAAAAGAYERDRYHDAMRITKGLVTQVPGSSTALELHGLVCYRLGRWRDALRFLGAAADLAGADESQLPVLMDCHRALHHRKRVRDIWDELRASSPPADVLVEGRLVMAATLRDEGRLSEAIRLLVDAGAHRTLRHPGDRHLRQWYLLADLYERSGDLPRARELFSRVVDADPGIADSAERLAALGRRHGRAPGPRKRRPPAR